MYMHVLKNVKHIQNSALAHPQHPTICFWDVYTICPLGSHLAATWRGDLADLAEGPPGPPGGNPTWRRFSYGDSKADLAVAFPPGEEPTWRSSGLIHVQ